MPTRNKDWKRVMGVAYYTVGVEKFEGLNFRVFKILLYY